MAAYGGGLVLVVHEIPFPSPANSDGPHRPWPPHQNKRKRTPGGKKEKEKTTFAPIYHSPQTNLKFAGEKNKNTHATVLPLSSKTMPELHPINPTRPGPIQSNPIQSNPIQSNPIQYSPTEPNPFNQSESLRDLPRPVLRRLQEVFNFLCPLRLHKPFLFGLGGALLLARYRPRDGPCDLTY